MYIVSTLYLEFWLTLTYLSGQPQLLKLSTWAMLADIKRLVENTAHWNIKPPESKAAHKPHNLELRRITEEVLQSICSSRMSYI